MCAIYPSQKSVSRILDDPAAKWDARGRAAEPAAGLKAKLSDAPFSARFLRHRAGRRRPDIVGWSGRATPWPIGAIRPSMSLRKSKRGPPQQCRARRAVSLRHGCRHLLSWSGRLEISDLPPYLENRRQYDATDRCRIDRDVESGRGLPR